MCGELIGRMLMDLVGIDRDPDHITLLGCLLVQLLNQGAPSELIVTLAYLYEQAGSFSGVF